MRSDTEVLLYWTAAQLTSCDSWHDMGRHEDLETCLVPWKIFSVDFHKRHSLKNVLENVKLSEIQHKHKTSGEKCFYYTTTVLVTGLEHLSSSATINYCSSCPIHCVFCKKEKNSPWKLWLFFFPSFCRSPRGSVGISHVSVLEGHGLVLWSQC